MDELLPIVDLDPPLLPTSFADPPLIPTLVFDPPELPDKIEASPVTKTLVTDAPILPGTEVDYSGPRGDKGETGLRGPQGTAANALGLLTLERVVGETLSGHRVVTIRDDGVLGYADSRIRDDVLRPYWLTVNAWSPGELATVVVFGVVKELGWNWIPGLPVYLSYDGQLTQTTPHSSSSEFMVVVGHSISSSEIFFSPSSPIGLLDIELSNEDDALITYDFNLFYDLGLTVDPALSRDLGLTQDFNLT